MKCPHCSFERDTAFAYCPKCGKPLREGDCGCPKKEIDPRLAVLQK